ncbi:Coiled-coil domain-containing protein 39 [Dinochytrium kinnereticum]|nr:Coiled-coil domain-containing protein 39 [Dinochytrium kinnereticum]
MERYKAKRNEIQVMQYNLQELDKSLSNLSTDESARQQAVTVIETKLAAMEKELKDQESKKERAFKSALRGSKELRKTAPEAGLNEIDFKIRECKDLGNLVLTELTKIMEQYPEIVNRVTQLFTEVLKIFFSTAKINPQKSISLPSRQVSRVPSRASSIRDDLSEASSNSSGRLRGASRTSSRASLTGLSGSQSLRFSTQVPRVTSGSAASSASRVRNSTGSMPHSSGINDGSKTSIQLPPKVPERTGFGTQSPSGDSVTGSKEKLGPITGSQRIKKPARPSSVASTNSNSSANSKGSLGGLGSK